MAGRRARSRSRRATVAVIVALLALGLGYLMLLGPRRVMRELDALRQDFADFYRNFFVDWQEGDG